MDGPGPRPPGGGALQNLEPGVPELGAEPQVFYRAMDFLLDADEQVQREAFFAVADLLTSRSTDPFDTTSTYFEIEPERKDGFREFAHSKDHRPDLPQPLASPRSSRPLRTPQAGPPAAGSSKPATRGSTRNRALLIR